MWGEQPRATERDRAQHGRRVRLPPVEPGRRRRVCQDEQPAGRLAGRRAAGEWWFRCLSWPAPPACRAMAGCAVASHTLPTEVLCIGAGPLADTGREGLWPAGGHVWPSRRHREAAHISRDRSKRRGRRAARRRLGVLQ